jgi:hypothetical protein
MLFYAAKNILATLGSKAEKRNKKYYADLFGKIQKEQSFVLLSAFQSFSV